MCLTMIKTDTFKAISYSCQMYFVAFEASVAQSEHTTVFVNILVNMDQGYKKPWTLDCDVLKTKYHPETF